MTKLRVFTIRAILDNKQQQQGNTGNGKDKLSYTTTTLIYITTTDKHGVPPTKRLFRVAMLDPSQGFNGPWESLRSGTTIVVVPSKMMGKGHSNGILVCPEKILIGIKEEDSITDVENTVFDLRVMEPLCFGLIDQRVLIGMITRVSLSSID
ncbi:hypothetical protein Tco_1122897 [Tanacetum coccineum]|uniref:Uncharacterized protein n=1 Tax=Tanacetum coccineum TaxID=301880 RepID=A0ABQ5J4M5_9ASTR